MRKVGITKNKKPSCNAGLVDYRGNFLIAIKREVQSSDNITDLKWTNRVLIKENRAEVTVKRKILVLRLYCFALYLFHRSTV